MKVKPIIKFATTGLQAFVRGKIVTKYNVLPADWVMAKDTVIMQVKVANNYFKFGTNKVRNAITQSKVKFKKELAKELQGQLSQLKEKDPKKFQELKDKLNKKV